MGVNGLWKLLEPSGKAVPLESLENQVLAVDVSIWLHQVTKGFQDATGNPLPNAHLLGLFHRLCKLLFYKIKPVFVFDGGVPHLKKQTVATRRQQKTKAELASERMREQLLKNLIKQKAVQNVLEDSQKIEISLPKMHTEGDMFQLPPPTQVSSEDSGSDSPDDPNSHRYLANDLHSLDVNSKHFKSLPADVRHDILVEMKETRKQSSWARLHEMPKESGDFSSYQMKRLLKRHSVQLCLEEAEKEMGGKSFSLKELEELMTDHGIIKEANLGKRIASDNTTRYIYVDGNEKVAARKLTSIEESTFSDSSPLDGNEIKAISNVAVDKNEEEYNGIDFLDTFEEDGEKSETEFMDSEYCQPLSNKLKVAHDFMFENSGLTQEQIFAVIKGQSKPRKVENPVYLDAVPSTSKMSQEESFVAVNADVTNVKDPEKMETQDDDKEKRMKNNGSSIIQHAVNDRNAVASRDSTMITIIDDESVSDSDVGFVDVEDVPPCVFSWNKKQNKDATALEVVIQTDKFNAEEDIFADVFNKVKDDVSAEHSNISQKISNASESSNNVSKNLKLQENMANGCHVTNDDTLHQKNVNNSDSAQLMNTSELQSGTSEETSQTLTVIEDVSEGKATEGKEVKIIGGLAPDNAQLVDIANAENKKEEITKSQENAHKTARNLLEKSAENISIMEDQSSVSQKNSATIQTQNVQVASPSSACSSKEENELINNVLESETGTDCTVDCDSRTKNDVPKKNEEIRMSFEDLKMLQNSLEQEKDHLMTEKGKQDRLATSITDQMYAEAQELLQLFGVPYIIAPMEAEAQCAFLDSVALTNGTITDDSDIWLFGGQQVYKNFFNQKKHVMKFRAADIQHYFKLARHQMISLALLVGSDYTVGLQGIGPVTALEILSAFPSRDIKEGTGNQVEALLSSLKSFRDWWKSGKAVGPGRTALRNKVKDLKLHEEFPNVSVMEAYLHPKVDESKEKFSWSIPDLSSLRMYAKEKFGWPRTKTDSILLPVMKKLDDRTRQLSLDSFIQRRPKLPLADGKLSKRVQRAVDNMGCRSDSSSDSEGPACKTRKVNAGTQREGTKREVNRGSNGRGRGRGKQPEKQMTAVQAVQKIGERLYKASSGKEFILQREKDKLNSLKNKLKAIEVFRKSKTGLDKTQRQRRKKGQELLEPKLSESSDSD